MELAVLWNVSVWKRTPWNAVPKMVVAPANLVTKATDARKNCPCQPEQRKKMAHL